jgi:hypothetical protein
MKFIFSIYIFLSVVVLFSCNKDSSEFIYTHNEKGLSYTKCYTIQWKDTLKGNTISLDSTVEMQFIGCTGFKLIEGKAFVGASMTLADSTGTVLFQNDDLFLDYDSIGFDPGLVKERVGIYLETSHPMVKGGTYKWKTKIWDKKGSGFIEAEALITMK